MTIKADRNKNRYPYNIVRATIVAHVADSGASDRGLARVRGANACQAWILALFGKALFSESEDRRSVEPCSDFGISLPSMRARPTKLRLAKALAQAAEALEERHGFNASNGWSQVEAKDIPTNEAYGFYDEINQIGERFEMWELLSKAAEGASMTIKRGTRFRYAIADCNALWVVKRKLGREAWLAAVVNEPFEAGGRKFDSDYVGTERAFLVKDIERVLRMTAVFEAHDRNSDGFYESLSAGQTVHYHNGFGEYVRCVVSVGEGGERVLRAVALVGGWSDYNLKPESYYMGKIASGEPFRPHASTVYEHAKAGPFDPRGVIPVYSAPH